MLPSEYLDNLSLKYKDKWISKLNATELSKEELSFLRLRLQPITIVAFSAEWCPDCYNAVPILIKIANQSVFVRLFLIDRDEHLDILRNFSVNGSMKIPFVIVLNVKFQELGRWSERSNLAYELIYESKMEAIINKTDDYRKRKVHKFKEASKQLRDENKRELLAVIRKSAYLYNSSLDRDILRDNTYFPEQQVSHSPYYFEQ